MTTEQASQPSRAPIDNVRLAIFTPMAVRAALQLGLFTPLAQGPMSPEELYQRSLIKTHGPIFAVR